jgi:hypothetical protein
LAEQCCLGNSGACVGQVTALGGLEAVITAKKWTEVSQPFQFPPSFTSKSFTLRKMYSRLLHDYEQVYYHHNAGAPTLPPGCSSFPLPHFPDGMIGLNHLRDYKVIIQSAMSLTGMPGSVKIQARMEQSWRAARR